MVDIHSATAEIRRGKKKEKETSGQNIMSASATQGGHNKERNKPQRQNIMAALLGAIKS